jgi:hypothetical protein
MTLYVFESSKTRLIHTILQEFVALISSMRMVCIVHLMESVGTNTIIKSNHTVDLDKLSDLYYLNISILFVYLLSDI